MGGGCKMKDVEIKAINELLSNSSTSWLSKQTGINRVTVWKLKNGKIKVENLTFKNGLLLLNLLKSGSNNKNKKIF